MAAPLDFFERPYPSANAVLLDGPRPVLVDPGFGADVPALRNWLAGRPVALVVNTHFDCDHVGANHVLQDLPIAAHEHDAAMVNARHPESCRARWLHQPVEPYRVTRPLQEGDVIDTGSVRWVVLHTPGHTPGHISLHAPDLGLLVAGDTVHADDVGWIDPHQPGALDAAEATVARLATLSLHTAFSGHGPPIHDPAAAFTAARGRLAAWRGAPQRMAWHGVKRVFAYALMIEGGLPEGGVLPYLSACPWFHDYAAQPFALSPDAFAAALEQEMLRSGAARWQAGRLVAGSPYVPPPAGWATAPTEPAQWL